MQRVAEREHEQQQCGRHEQDQQARRNAALGEQCAALADDVHEADDAEHDGGDAGYRRRSIVADSGRERDSNGGRSASR